ncbi:MAG: extracellular solute-binding protein [Phycisphaerae bacterium]
MANSVQTKKEMIKNELITAITSGKYQPGQKLMGEARFANQLGVSPGTMREVLNDLANENIVIRKGGSGTYVNIKQKDAITIHVPILDPKKILVKHLWGKIVEHSHKNHQKIILRQILHENIHDNSSKNRLIVRLFTWDQRAAFFETTMNDLKGLVDMGMCEDLTDRLASWPQKDNLYQVAVDAATVKNRIYGLPFHSILSGMVYHKSRFEQLKIEPQEAFSSLDAFVRTVERVAREPDVKYSFLGTPLNSFLMFFFHGFYENLSARMTPAQAPPIERAVGIEALNLLKQLKWKLRAYIPTPHECLDLSLTQQILRDFFDGLIPISMQQLNPKRNSDLYHAKMPNPLGFAVPRLHPQGRPFVLFNSYIWIINNHLEPAIKECAWSFLKEYVNPQSEYELDIRHVEEGEFNHRSNSFIKACPRVPDDPEYESTRKEIFKFAEPELPYPSPVFDLFTLAACKVLNDPDASVDRAYDNYISLFQNQAGVFSRQILSY